MRRPCSGVLLRTSVAKSVEDRLLAPRQILCAPHLLDLEVAQVVRRCAGLGEITAERGGVTLADRRDMPINRFPHEFLLTRMWGVQHNVTAYDAAYMALAQALGIALLTRDHRLAAAAHHIEVELL